MSESTSVDAITADTALTPEPGTEPATEPGTAGGDGLEMCSLVMKGGITSGVVYPLAVTELATRYRFRRIGGSSAGGVAAVLAAAAEYHRRATGTPAPEPVPAPADGPPATLPHDPNAVGFDRLRRLPDHMRTTLPTLFEPSPGTKGVYNFLIAWIEHDWSTAKKLLVSIGRLIRWGWLPFLLTTAVALLPGFFSAAALVGGLRAETWGPVLRATALWLPLALILGLLASGIVLGLGAWRAINANGFGMVNGHRRPTAADPDPAATSDALTDWLTREINVTAGLDPLGRPLTFGDLWGEDAVQQYRNDFTVLRTFKDRPEVPGVWQYRRNVASVKRIQLDPDLDLKMMTTCLTHRVPHTFPFFDDSFAYCPRCLDEYFPRTVCTQIAETSRPMSADPAVPGDLVCPRHGEALRRFPFAPDIPVVMAARLSLSFPVLISAVPFYYLDGGQLSPDAAPDDPARKLEVVTAWFSNGGITSNFPMQFFDDWLPRRPTFGINLADYNPRYHPGEVNLPRATRRVRPAETPITSVLGLLSTAVFTMQDWPDQLQMDSPGFKDRIVTVCTKPGEGGLNLKMSPDAIASLSGKGAIAGVKLRDDFDFTLHRWIRFRIAMNGLSLAMVRFREDLPSFSDAVPAPWTGNYDFEAQREEVVRAEAEGLADLADRWAAQGWPANRDTPPRPEPTLRFGNHNR